MFHAFRSSETEEIKNKFDCIGVKCHINVSTSYAFIKNLITLGKDFFFFFFFGQWKLSYSFLDDKRCEKGSSVHGTRAVQLTKSLSAFLRQAELSSNLAYADFINFAGCKQRKM